MARQTIAHGKQLDVATPTEIAALIAEAFSTQGVTEYRRLKGAINLNAAGAGVSQPPNDVLDVPSNYDLLLERVAIGGSGATNALITLYENQVQDSDLLEVIQMGAAGKYSDAFSNMIYLTANSVLVINITGGTPNLQVTYNLQGRLRKHQ